MVGSIQTGVSPHSISSSDAYEASQLLELIRGAERTGNEKKEGEYRQTYDALVHRAGFSDSTSFEVALAARQAMKR